MASDDPLLPWLRSIREAKQLHPDDKSKVFPHVSDCYKELRDIERYQNDRNFLKICIQLADCSPDPLQVMAELDKRGIGCGLALFYEAYATCLEGKRRFGDANHIYKCGISRQAQPTEKLINSYQLFRDRMEMRKKRKQDQVEQQAKKSCQTIEEKTHARQECDSHDSSARRIESCEGASEPAHKAHLLSDTWYTNEGLDVSFEELRLASMAAVVGMVREKNNVVEMALSKPIVDHCVSALERVATGSFGEETIQIRNFAAKAITGKEKDVEDARHHGLVDPTINTREALQDILSMFCKPMDVGKAKGTRKSSHRQGMFSVSADAPSPRKEKQVESSSGSLQTQSVEFSVFKDDEQEQGDVHNNQASSFLSLSDRKSPSLGAMHVKACELSVFKDDEEDNEGRRERKIMSPIGGLHAHASGFTVFKDDERDEPCTKIKRPVESPLGALQKQASEFSVQEPSSRPIVIQKSSIAIYNDERPSLGKSGQNAEGRGCFSFKGSAMHDKENSKDMPLCSKFINQESGLFVFKDDGDGTLSKGKALCTNTNLAHGMENLLSQSPLT